MKDAYHILHFSATGVINANEMHLNGFGTMTLAGHAELVRTQKKADALASGINNAFISQLVETFYGAVRQDDLLGPIFARHIRNWPLHLARMKDFWASVMIESGRFSGSPMQKHIAVGGLEAAHFARWLALWAQVLSEKAPNPDVAERFQAAAKRIGESLLTGIEINRGGLATPSARGAPGA
jgi:hemoglobin